MEAGFITELDCHWKPDSDKIIVLDSPLSFYSAELDLLLNVGTGFESDGSSVPRVPIAYMLYGGRCPREGVLHDAAFRMDFKPELTFMQANKVFLEAMKCRKKPLYVRHPMYWGVVIGGWPSYHKKYLNHKF